MLILHPICKWPARITWKHWFGSFWASHSGFKPFVHPGIISMDTLLLVEAVREDPQALPGVEDQPRGGLEVSPSPTKHGEIWKISWFIIMFLITGANPQFLDKPIYIYIYILSVVYVISCRSDPIISYWNPIRFPWNPVKFPFWQVKSQFITPVRLVISLCWLSISGSGSGAWFVYLI